MQMGDFFYKEKISFVLNHTIFYNKCKMYFGEYNNLVRIKITANDASPMNSFYRQKEKFGI
jgi:tRNA threonylcarbamoyladenosine modification (KEOPS) complex  Pcc1 subunit